MHMCAIDVRITQHGVSQLQRLDNLDFLLLWKAAMAAAREGPFGALGKGDFEGTSQGTSWESCGAMGGLYGSLQQCGPQRTVAL